VSDDLEVGGLDNLVQAPVMIFMPMTDENKIQISGGKPNRLHHFKELETSPMPTGVDKK
jgi:hypothetical protein